MEYRTLGKTHLQVSALGFGCGAVGGLLVKGSRQERIDAVQRAIDLGITYFDTAAIYGDGLSETHLGEALREVGGDANDAIVVGTKVRLTVADLANIEQSARASVEQSLRRLGRESVDLIQLHNALMRDEDDAEARQRGWMRVDEVATVMHVFRQLRDEGKVRFWGINGLGDPDAVQRALTGETHTIQLCYNLLNPTAGIAAPIAFPFLDHRQLIDQAAQLDVGVLAIRVLAAGALSGSMARHSHAAQQVDPIASGQSLADDVALAQRFNFLVEEGIVDSLAEAAIRFAIGKPGISSVLVGLSTREQLEVAADYANRGALPADALAAVHAVWAGFGAA